MQADIKEMALEATTLLESLIRIPSISREEKEAADHLQNYMEEVGLETGRDGNNVWSLSPCFDLSKPTILLNSHLDTVKPTSSWIRDPFTPSWENGRLYGLGSNDAGASLCSLLQVFRALSRTAQSFNTIFLASAEEEVSGKGGMEHVRDLLPPFQVALVGEPTGNQPAIAEKGLMVLDVTARGKSGHAARNEGVNAIYEALDDICWFRDYQFEKVSPLLGPVKMSVTVIHAGTQHNVIPDTCTFMVDVRSNECYSNEEICQIIRSQVKGQVSAHSFRLGSSSISVEHPIVQRALAMGLKPFGSPTLSDQALLRCPSMKMGPGQSSRSHTADEYILLSEIQEGIERYWDLLNCLSFPFSPVKG